MSGTRIASRSMGSRSARTTRWSSSGPRASWSCSHSPTVRPSEKAWVWEMLSAIRWGFRSRTTRASRSHWALPHSSRCRPSGARSVSRMAWYRPPCEAPPSARRSTPRWGPRSKNTEMVRRRAKNVVGGTSARDTRSSWYSRMVTIHRSTPCSRIKRGRTVSRRWVSHRCWISACSRKVPRGRSGAVCWARAGNARVRGSSAKPKVRRIRNAPGWAVREVAVGRMPRYPAARLPAIRACAGASRPFATRLARHCARHPVALGRLAYGADRGTITSQSDQPSCPTAGAETVDALEFLARVVAHIPTKGQVLQRYYGWYANRTRGIRRKAGADEPPPRPHSAPARTEIHAPEQRFIARVTAEPAERRQHSQIADVDVACVERPFQPVQSEFPFIGACIEHRHGVRPDIDRSGTCGQFLGGASERHRIATFRIPALQRADGTAVIQQAEVRLHFPVRLGVPPLFMEDRPETPTGLPHARLDLEQRAELRLGFIVTSDKLREDSALEHGSGVQRVALHGALHERRCFSWATHGHQQHGIVTQGVCIVRVRLENAPILPLRTSPIPLPYPNVGEHPP